jgi:hypothetical protein
LVRGSVLVSAAFVIAALLGLAAQALAQSDPTRSADPPSIIAGAAPVTASRSGDRPSLTVGVLTSDLRLDGSLDEDAWAGADAIEDLTMLEPTQGGKPTGRSRV